MLACRGQPGIQQKSAEPTTAGVGRLERRDKETSRGQRMKEGEKRRPLRGRGKNPS